MSRRMVVARHELVIHARRWEFLLVTLGLPLLTIALFVIASVPNYIYLRGRQMEAQTVHVGIVDASQTVRFPAEHRGDGAAAPAAGTVGSPPDAKAPQPLFTFRVFRDTAAGEQALRAREIAYLYVFPADYLESRRAECLTLRRTPFDVSPRPPMALLIREHLLAGRVDAKTLAQIRKPIVETPVVLDDQGRRVDDPVLDQLVSLFLPYAMMALMVMALMGSSSYIVRGLTEERESRIQEVLLACVRPADLFYGKLIGLGALGLIQTTVWAAVGLPLSSGLLSRVQVSPLTFVLFLVLFMLGFTLYAAILAGIGAVGSSEKEGQQIFAAFVLVFSSPLLFLPILLDAPNGWLARAFSYFPFTAPLMMVMRLTNTQVTSFDLAVSLGILLVSALMALRVSLRVFEIGLLLHGKTPTPTEIWRALRTSVNPSAKPEGECSLPT